MRLQHRTRRDVLFDSGQEFKNWDVMGVMAHVFATTAASEVSTASLSKVLGHRRMATTSDLYAHPHDPDAVKATAAVSNVFERMPKSD